MMQDKMDGQILVDIFGNACVIRSKKNYIPAELSVFHFKILTSNVNNAFM